MKYLSYPIKDVIKASAFHGVLLGAWMYITVWSEVPPMKILTFSAAGGLWFGFGTIPANWISAKIQTRFGRKSNGAP